MTDADLVRRALDGDQAAFTTLVDRHYPRCARFAYRMLGSREDAEDALQETFLRAYRALRRYEERNGFSAWLSQILVNQCRTMARRRGRHDRLFIGDGHDATMAASVPPAEWANGADDLQRVLDRMEPLLREAFILKYVEELTYEEMAAVTGAGISALKMRVKRACDWLRPRVEALFNA